VTQWELPQCGEVTLGATGADSCASINADGTYQGPFINYYIAPSGEPGHHRSCKYASALQGPLPQSVGVLRRQLS
jgi:hypothetical protein